VFGRKQGSGVRFAVEVCVCVQLRGERLCVSSRKAGCAFHSNLQVGSRHSGKISDGCNVDSLVQTFTWERVKPGNKRGEKTLVSVTKAA